jgi:hypothetical protein
MIHANIQTITHYHSSKKSYHKWEGMFAREFL